VTTVPEVVEVELGVFPDGHQQSDLIDQKKEDLNGRRLEQVPEIDEQMGVTALFELPE
jgi:hypothetical protein